MKSSLGESIRIKAGYARSVNVERDAHSEHVAERHIITSRGIELIKRVANVCKSQQECNKSWALIGPYGSGKSSFAIYLSQLLSASTSECAKKSRAKLEAFNSETGKAIKRHIGRSAGYCSILLSGTPEPLGRAFLRALREGVGAYLKDKRVAKGVMSKLDGLLKQGHTAPSEILEALELVQQKVASAGGKGLLVVIDELGKFLEYDVRNSGNEMFLLQVLAEHAHKKDKTNVLLFTLMHQSFDVYAKGLGPQLKNEWIKIQGRYEVVSFLEAAEQSMRIVGQVFEKSIPAKSEKEIKARIKGITTALMKQKCIPDTLGVRLANNLFYQCYPLHPITLLLLPVLCQKVAQNERTLFSYLNSPERYGFRDSLSQKEMGDFIYPHEIYDYFIANQPLQTGDMQTHRRWVEVVSALERLDSDEDMQVEILKTIGLFNIMGAQGNFKPSDKVLRLTSDKPIKKGLGKLLDKSLICYRKFNQEYRVWQGSDFDLESLIREQVDALIDFDPIKILNDEKWVPPIVAKRYSIDHHATFYFNVVFCDNNYKKIPAKASRPRIIFYLSENEADKALLSMHATKYFSDQDIIVRGDAYGRIQDLLKEKIALEKIGTTNAELKQDPVAQKEYKDHDIVITRQLNELLEDFILNPAGYYWCNKRKNFRIKHRRALQEFLSNVLEDVYKYAPIIKNEIINKDELSPAGVQARRNLLLGLWTNSDKKDFGIDKYPAEKGMYLAVMQATGIHKEDGDKWVITRPRKTKNSTHNFGPAWEAIEKYFDNTAELGKPLTELDAVLMSAPYGVKKGVLPVLYMLVYFMHRDEMVVYEEGQYVPFFLDAHLERFLKRPDTFTFQQFRIAGMRADLVREYERSLLDGEKTASVLGLFKPFAKFIADLPNYTHQTKKISERAQKIRTAFSTAKSPQALLFETLPELCGCSEDKLNQFGAILKDALREIKNAYPKMLEAQKAELCAFLGIEKDLPLKDVREKAKHFCERLKAYSSDQNLSGFIQTVVTDYGDDEQWLERVLMYAGDKPTKSWNDDDAIFSAYKMKEYGSQIIDLEKIRLHIQENDLHDPNAETVLVVVQVSGRERKSEIVHIRSGEEWSAVIAKKAKEIADSIEWKKRPFTVITGGGK